MPQTKRKKAKIRRDRAKKVAEPRKMTPLRPEAHALALELAEIDERTLTDYMSRLVRTAAEKAGIVSKGK